MFIVRYGLISCMRYVSFVKGKIKLKLYSVLLSSLLASSLYTNWELILLRADFSPWQLNRTQLLDRPLIRQYTIHGTVSNGSSLSAIGRSRYLVTGCGIDRY